MGLPSAWYCFPVFCLDLLFFSLYTALWVSSHLCGFLWVAWGWVSSPDSLKLPISVWLHSGRLSLDVQQVAHIQYIHKIFHYLFPQIMCLHLNSFWWMVELPLSYSYHWPWEYCLMTPGANIVKSTDLDLNSVLPTPMQSQPRHLSSLNLNSFAFGMDT